MNTKDGKSAFREAVNTALSATAVGIVVEFVFYGLDSYKVMKQMGEKVRVSQLFRGTLPLVVFGVAPSYTAFFICYNPLRNVLSNQFGAGNESASVLISSIAAGVPSSIVLVPADVIKKQLLTTNSAVSASSSSGSSVTGVLRQIYATSGVSGLFLGWRANLIRDVPFMAIKMSLYEGLARLYLRAKHSESANHKTVISADSLTSLEASGVGFASGALTAVATCPIDCVNTRIKSGELASHGVVSAHAEIVRRDGVKALFRGVAPRAAILGGGSTLFWYLQATVMHRLTGLTEVPSH
jgi:hypothetical protein